MIGKAWTVAGHICVGFGILGIALPLLPTTPFLLLALMCYSKGSQKFHDWLLNHPRFGDYIHSWQKSGAIPLRAKKVACILITINLCIIWTLGPNSMVIQVTVTALLTSVILFILSRPYS